MQSAQRFRVVLVTAPSLRIARDLARAALAARLAACVNLVPGVQSHYWWRGKLDSSREVLLLFKTTQTRLTRLERCLRAHHPYDTPEIVALPLQSSTPRYLVWLRDSLRAPAARRNPSLSHSPGRSRRRQA